ncbi:MAG: cation transporter [Proteobacteria bacterium]|nr:cation transporter [Pseudomonadota bacterium]
MKRFMLVSAFLMGLCPGAFAAEQSVTLSIENMTCAVCPITVTKAIEGVEGVKRVSVNFETKSASIVYDDAITSWEEVAAASTNAGYPAGKVE